MGVGVHVGVRSIRTWWPKPASRKPVLYGSIFGYSLVGYCSGLALKSAASDEGGDTYRRSAPLPPASLAAIVAAGLGPPATADTIGWRRPKGRAVKALCAACLQAWCIVVVVFVVVAGD